LDENVKLFTKKPFTNEIHPLSTADFGLRPSPGKQWHNNDQAAEPLAEDSDGGDVTGAVQNKDAEEDGGTLEVVEEPANLPNAGGVEVMEIPVGEEIAEEVFPEVSTNDLPPNVDCYPDVFDHGQPRELPPVPKSYLRDRDVDDNQVKMKRKVNKELIRKFGEIGRDIIRSINEIKIVAVSFENCHYF
jgi:hypothetical protein